MGFNFNEIITAHTFIGTVRTLPSYVQKFYDNGEFILASPQVYERMIRLLSNFVGLPEPMIKSLKELEIRLSRIRTNNMRKEKWLEASVKSIPEQFYNWPTNVYYTTPQLIEKASLQNGNQIVIQINAGTYIKNFRPI